MALRKITLPSKTQKPASSVQAPAKPASKPLGALKAKKPVEELFDDNTSLSGDASDGFAVARQINAERSRQAEIRQNLPREFWMNPGEGGEKGVVLILTDTCRLKDPNPKKRLPFFHYMHHWGYQKGVKGSGKSEVCLKDNQGGEGCELCAHLGREGAHEMVLSCIDTRSITIKNGPNAGKTVKNDRKVIVVKTKMIPKYERLYKEHGTFRGMAIRVFRDSKDDMSTGSEIKFIKFLTEQELAKYGEAAQPVDYHKAYPRPTNAELRQRYNIQGGSSGIGGGEFGSGDVDDAIPF